MEKKENLMKENYSFSTSLVFAYLKGEIEITERDIKTKCPLPLFGFIPTGSRDEQVMPLRNVGAASVMKFISFHLLFAGLAFLFFSYKVFVFVDSFSDFMQWLIFPIIGILFVLHCIKTVLVIQRNADDYYISVPFYERKKMDEIKQKIMEALDYEADKVDIDKSAINKESLELQRKQLELQIEQLNMQKMALEKQIEE